MNQSPTIKELVDFAAELAWAGGRRTLAYFNAGVAVDSKADGTPVTQADREAETVMRDLIKKRFPHHDIVGEEFGATETGSDYRWILDPIDGTKTFVSGVPLYGTLVGLEIAGEPSVGVIYMPALDEMVVAGRGTGCHWNGRACGVSAVQTLETSVLCVTDDNAARLRKDANFDALVDDVAMVRTWADCYGYLLVATGRAEVAMDAEMAIWDCAALLPIIEEAGGSFTSWKGERTINGGDAVATNGRLHAAVIGRLKG